MSAPEGAAARQVVERAFASESVDASTGAEVLTALDRARAKLARSIAPILGDAGFDAMFSRALRRSLATVATATRPHLADGSPFEARFREWLVQEDADVVRAIAVAALTSLFDSLTAMIGEELASKLVRHAWSDAFDGSASAEKS